MKLKKKKIATRNENHNSKTAFDPFQNERLDINPGCFMKMPFICPSTLIILSELTEKKKKEKGERTVKSHVLCY